MGTIGLGKASLKEDDERVARFAEGSGYQFLSFGDGGCDVHGAIGCCGKALFLKGCNLLGGQSARALDQLALGVLGKKHVAERGAWNVADGCILSYTEQIGIGTLQCQAAWVVLYVAYHVGELVLSCEDAVVVLFGEEAGGIACGCIARGDSREC